MRVVGGRGRPGALGGTSSQGEDQAPGSSGAEQRFVNIDTSASACIIIDTAVFVIIDTAPCIIIDTAVCG